MSLKKRSKKFSSMVSLSKKLKIYPYFKPIANSRGTEVEVDGRKMVMVCSNDYLGLTQDQRVKDAAIDAVERWGVGPGGSRFLSGNTTMHEQLEERLADFVGMKQAVVHTTGFLSNLGGIGSIVTPEDIILCDRENHASIFEGCKVSQAPVIPYKHNDVASAEAMLAKAQAKCPDGHKFLVTEGVFSMSGHISTALPDIVKLKKKHKDLYVYLDDAHGLGVMGKGGRGTANHFGVTRDVDFIMGTFSKAFACIGGFVASDDTDITTYLRHHSKGLIFSAALPAPNVATVLKCLDIIESEPELIDRLWEITAKVRRGYEDVGLMVGSSDSPIIPICIGSEEKALKFAADLWKMGVFALPVVHPAVPKGQSLIRTAYMSTHTDEQIDFVLECLDKLARKHKVKADDFNDKSGFLAFLDTEKSGDSDSVAM